MPSKSEIAWAAGFFEGEGCFHAIHNRATLASGESRLYVYARLVVSSTDRDMLEKFQDIVGVGRIYKGRRVAAHHKDQFQLSICSEDAYRIAEWFWPWLSDRRKAQFERMLEKVQTNARDREMEHS